MCQSWKILLQAVKQTVLTVRAEFIGTSDRIGGPITKWKFATKQNIKNFHLQYQAHLRYSQLTLFTPMPDFYTPWKRQKTKGFLEFSGGIEMRH